MAESFDAKRASLELTSYIRDVLSPPDRSAPMKSVLGAYILKTMLQSAGYAIVPLKPTQLMERHSTQAPSGPSRTATPQW